MKMKSHSFIKQLQTFVPISSGLGATARAGDHDNILTNVAWVAVDPPDLSKENAQENETKHAGKGLPCLCLVHAGFACSKLEN